MTPQQNIDRLNADKIRLEQSRTEERIMWRINGKSIHADNISMLNKSIKRINIEIEGFKMKL